METDHREMHWTPAKIAGVVVVVVVFIAYLFVLPIMLGETRPASDPLPPVHERF